MISNHLLTLYYLYCFNKSAYWDRRKIEAFQIKQLRRIIKHAYDNVEFYHKTFRKYGLYPDEVRSKKDLNKLPILKKDEIRSNPNSFISRQANIPALRKLSTSGSTGKPLFIYLSPSEDKLRKARHLRANISCGQKPRDKWVLITSPKHFGAITRLQRLLDFYVPTPVSVFNSIDVQVSAVESLRPSVLDGYSSSLSLLARRVDDLCLTTIRPKFVIGGAELIDDASTRLIERVFNAPFFDQYACVEFDRVSWQCTEKIGYHIDSDSLILQFTDEFGDEVAVGERGNIICTSLFNYSMPFIRYAIGDMGVESDEVCSCGRNLPLMKVMEGRADSILVLPDGRIMSPRAFTTAINMFPQYALFDQFRITQKKIDYFQVIIKTKDKNVDEVELSTNLSKYIKRLLNLSSSSINLEVLFVDDIPVNKTGKLMIAVSEMKNTV